MKKIIAGSAVFAVAALSGCAPSQMDALLNGTGNHAQASTKLIPGRVVTVSPLAGLRMGFLAASSPAKMSS